MAGNHNRAQKGRERLGAGNAPLSVRLSQGRQRASACALLSRGIQLQRKAAPAVKSVLQSLWAQCGEVGGASPTLLVSQGIKNHSRRMAELQKPQAGGVFSARILTANSCLLPPHPWYHPPSPTSKGLLANCGAWTSHCSDFSCCSGVQALGCAGFSSCGSWDLELSSCGSLA